MKVILLQDVAKIGKKHAVAEVPDGYAQNQLIPKGLAKPATKENIKHLEKLQEKQNAAADAVLERFFATKKALADQVIELSAKKNDNGHLFAAIKVEDIVVALQKSAIDVEPTMIHISSPIKETGQHTIELRCADKKAEFTINII